MMEKVKNVLEDRYEEIGWLGIVFMGLSLTVLPNNVGNQASLVVPFAIGLILWVPSLVFWKKE